MKPSLPAACSRLGQLPGSGLAPRTESDHDHINDFFNGVIHG